MWRTAVVALAILGFASSSLAQGIVVFDFETLDEGPISKGGLPGIPGDPGVVPFPFAPYGDWFADVTDPGTGITLRISRDGHTDFGGAVPIFPFLNPPMVVDNIAPFGAPPSYGSRSLSPFADPSIYADPMVGTFMFIEILNVPPGMGVERIEWEQGDFFPSDVDTYTTTSFTVGGGTGPVPGIERGIDETPFLPPFGSSIGFVQRQFAITKIALRGGSDPPFSHSLYFDNFTLFLSPVVEGTDQFAGGSDQPGSDPGGDPFSTIIGGSGQPPLNTAPEADAGENFTILTQEQAATVIPGTASDADGDDLTCRWLDEFGAEVQPPDPVLPDGTCPLDLGTLALLSVGEHTFVLEVTDGLATTSAGVVVTVNNSPPVPAPNPGGTVEIGTNVVLDGQVADFDGDAVSLEWRRNGDVLNEDPIVVTPPAGGDPAAVPAISVDSLDLGLGAHEILLVADDGINLEVAAAITVTVIDTTAPTLMPDASKTILWPPNHNMCEVTILANASDNSGSLTLSVDFISSSEPDEADGDGNFLPDYELLELDQGTGLIRVNLRAERSGKGDGRTYTVRITATDDAGNASTSDVVVVAPHSKKK